MEGGTAAAAVWTFSDIDESMLQVDENGSLYLPIEIIVRVFRTHKGEIERAVIEGVALGRQYQARVFIAQHWQLAVKHAAYGIELTLEQCAQADLAVIKDAGLRLGIKVNSLYQALEALKLGPSYLVLGGVMSDEVAVEKLALIAQLLKHRCVVVAKSSATVNEVAQVLASGGDGSNTKCATAIV